MGVRDNVLGGSGVIGMLGQNPLGMVTVTGCKCPLVRVLIREVECGQRTGRWIKKTCQKL